MKNIVIVILSVLLLASLLYGYVQRGIAMEQEKLALANAVVAEQNAKEAMNVRILAEEQAQLARQAAERAEQAYQDCMKKKK